MIDTRIVNDTVTINLDQRFVCDSVAEFRNSYVRHEGKAYVVDFRRTEHMDSAGFGMLLNMKRFLEARGDIAIQLINCRPHIGKVLIIAGFCDRFRIG